jgi:glycerate 2-kinase
MNPSAPSLREAVVGSLVGALARMDVAARVRDALPAAPPARARVRIIAAGKAAPRMAWGALQRWPYRIERVLLVVPDGLDVGINDARVEVMRAPHPIPDPRSVSAAEHALSLAAGHARDLVLALVSGGASAILCAPAAGLSLCEKQEATVALLRSGATIQEVNVVRRHLSRIKGGGLTRAAYPGRVLALIASDVIDGGLSDIGSGPTTVDGSTVEDARRVLARFAPTLAQLPLHETLKQDDAPARRQRAHLIAKPEDLAFLAADALLEEGLAAHVVPSSVADMTVLADEYAEAARALRPGEAMVRAAEPSLPLPLASRVGRGGRAGHLAALVARRLPPHVVFLCGATDGVDGSSGAAGAAVDAGFVAQFAQARYDRALADFDTAALHEEAKTALLLGPTGLNFADLHILARR